MRNVRNICICMFLTITSTAFAQFTFITGKHSLEITGGVNTHFNYRLYKPGEVNKASNMFALRDAQFQLEGRWGNSFEYELQADFADLVFSQNDPENPGLMDASVTYKSPWNFSINAGYGKVKYSRANLVPFIYSPFFTRAEIVRGNVFTRRDLGVSISANAWKQLFNFSFGIFNGMGEYSLKGKNDRSGKFEYVARAEIAWPVRNRFVDFDQNDSPFPIFSAAINGRYVERDNTIYNEYSLNVIGGKKWTYGGEFSVKYHGAMISGELHQMRIQPNDINRLESKPTNYFRAGGYYIQASYFSKAIKSFIAGRYEELNQSDVFAGYSRRVTLGLGYCPRGFNTMIRFNYTRILAEEVLSGQEPSKWTDQFRIGVQYLFR